MVPDVVTLGETMVVFLAGFGEPLAEAVEFRCHVAGSETTVAVGLSRLGRSVGWISRLGNDPFGHQVVRCVRGEGVDTSHVRMMDTHPTGLLTRSWGGESIDVRYYRQNSAASMLCPNDIDEGYVSSAQLLFVTGITAALSASARQATFSALDIARAARIPIAFDPNYRAKLWAAASARPVLRDMLRRADIVLCGVEEAELLVGENDPLTAAGTLLSHGPRVVAIKQGRDGAYVASASEGFRQPPSVTAAVDPVGAGDAFTAGFLAAWLEGLGLQTCARWGTRNGAACVATKGDTEGLLRKLEMLEESTTDVSR